MVADPPNKHDLAERADHVPPPAPSTTVTGASVFAGGDTAARNYGKDTNIGNLPTSAELLQQIAADKKAGENTSIGRLPYATESDIAKKLTPQDLKTIGSMVDAIGQRNYDHSGNKPGSLEDLVKGIDAKKLIELKDMVTLELERKKLAPKYEVDVQPYQDPKGKDQAAMVVTNTENRTSVGFTTEGEKNKKKIDELLRFLYD